MQEPWTLQCHVTLLPTVSARLCKAFGPKASGQPARRPARLTPVVVVTVDCFEGVVWPSHHPLPTNDVCRKQPQRTQGQSVNLTAAIDACWHVLTTQLTLQGFQRPGGDGAATAASTRHNGYADSPALLLSSARVFVPASKASAIFAPNCTTTQPPCLYRSASRG